MLFRSSRFEREAKTVAALNHPNIVTLHSVEEVDASTGPVLFITMELVSGRTLTEVLAGGAMDREKLYRLLRLGIEKGASDIHFQVGYLPLYRFNGDLVELRYKVLTEKDTEAIGRILVDNRKIFLTAGSVAFSFQLMRSARQLLVPLFGVTVGLDAGTIGFIYSLSAAVDMSLFYPVGIVLDRWGRKSAGIPSALCFVVGLILLPFAQGFYSLLAAGLTLGFANGLSVEIGRAHV